MTTFYKDLILNSREFGQVVGGPAVTLCRDVDVFIDRVVITGDNIGDVYRMLQKFGKQMLELYVDLRKLKASMKILKLLHEGLNNDVLQLIDIRLVMYPQAIGKIDMHVNNVKAHLDKLKKFAAILKQQM